MVLEVMMGNMQTMFDAKENQIAATVVLPLDEISFDRMADYLGNYTGEYFRCMQRPFFLYDGFGVTDKSNFGRAFIDLKFSTLNKYAKMVEGFDDYDFVELVSLFDVVYEKTKGDSIYHGNGPHEERMDRILYKTLWLYFGGLYAVMPVTSEKELGEFSIESSHPFVVGMERQGPEKLGAYLVNEYGFMPTTVGTYAMVFRD